MICGVCGNKIMPGEENCSRCGSKVTKNDEEVKSSFQELSVEENNGPVMVAPEEVAKVDNAAPVTAPPSPDDVMNSKKKEKKQKAPKQPKGVTVEKKSNGTNGNKKYIIITVLILLGLIVIGAANYLNYIDNKQEEQSEVKEEKTGEIQQEIVTLKYVFAGFEVYYPSNCIPQENNGVLYLTDQSKKIEYTITIHDNANMEIFNQNKENLKNNLISTGYTILKEEAITKDGIAYYVYDLSALINNQTINYQYFISDINNALIEVMVYNEDAESLYDANLGLKTIVSGTTKIS